MAEEQSGTENGAADGAADGAIKKAPVGLMGIVLVMGPSLIWCGEYIGSGEVILATRTGAILGPAVLWALVIGISLKYWIGLCGARYTVVTGEGMIDCFSRVPGPKNWLVWLVFLGQGFAGVCSIGAIAVAAATFLNNLIPIADISIGSENPINIPVWGIIVMAFCFTVAWIGSFNVLKMLMAGIVGIIVVGVLYVASKSLPPVGEIVSGVFGFSVPEVPAWATEQDPQITTSWGLILPMVGWAAGGFASQVWYAYWVMGAGYGMTRKGVWGARADEPRLAALTEDEARSLLGWVRVVRWDATAALVIGMVVTCAFLLAGSGILGAQELAPSGNDLVLKLSEVFASQWNKGGATLFILAGALAMVSTQMGQLSGWPRLLADCFRLICPPFSRIAPKTQFRIFLSLFLVTNLTVLTLFGLRPVLLVSLGAILDGLLLVPIQALAVGWGIFVVQKKLLSPAAWELLRPRWYHAAGLAAGFVVFTYFCVFQVPAELVKLWAALVDILQE